MSDAEPVLSIWESHEAVAATKRRAQAARLLNYMQRNHTQRINDGISRAFLRTLSELRKQQDWRRRRKAIWVDEALPKMSPDSVSTAESFDLANQTNLRSGGLLK
jgi:hypothetical protein